jgi:hypothetical protein
MKAGMILFLAAESTFFLERETADQSSVFDFPLNAPLVELLVLWISQ